MLSGLSFSIAGCGVFSRERPTRTPVPTFTPTPFVAGAAQPANTPAQTPVGEATPVVQMAPPTSTDTPLPPPPTDTPTPVPPTPTPTVPATA
ncbi:MAG TPA: hypothetical protein VNK95_11375, partial [Caldilineaceae bacterium]|nr:hypothetical protein [Caldilineaceae bacterium]